MSTTARHVSVLPSVILLSSHWVSVFCGVKSLQSHFVPCVSQILSMVRVEEGPTCAETTLSATIRKHLQSANAKMDFRETRKPSNVKVENLYKKCPVFRYSELLSSFIKIQYTHTFTTLKFALKQFCLVYISDYICMYMCIYIYIYMYICVYIYIYIY